MPSQGPALTCAIFVGLFVTADISARAVSTPVDQHSIRGALTTQVPIPIPEVDPGRTVLCTGRAPTCGCGASAACVGRRWTCLFPAESCNGRDDDCDGLVDEGGDELCDDGISCTTDKCTAVVENFTEPPYPTPGSTRTQCVHEPVHSRCNDGATCSVDRCAPEGELGYTLPDENGCVSRPQDKACDDGCHCTGVEACNPARAGVTPLRPGTGCLPGVPECDSDHSACTIELCCETSATCLEALSSAQRSSLEGACSTAAAIGIGRTVVSGSGVPLLCPGASTRLRCDDGNPCTTDSCDPGSGCRHDPVPDNTQLGLQDEGCTRMACFGGQVRFGRNDSRDTPCQRWHAGRCAQRTCEAALPPAPGAVPPSQGTRFLCVRPTAADLQARCEDGIFCNGIERCDPLFDWSRPGFTPKMPGCRPGIPVRCDDGLTCTRDSCDEAGRRCLNEPTVPGACNLF